MRTYVAKRRPEISAEHGCTQPGAFIPQTHLRGREDEAGVGEIGVPLHSSPATCSRSECHSLARQFNRVVMLRYLSDWVCSTAAAH